MASAISSSNDNTTMANTYMRESPWSVVSSGSVSAVNVEVTEMEGGGTVVICIAKEPVEMIGLASGERELLAFLVGREGWE